MLSVGSRFSDEVHCIVMCVHHHPHSVHCSLFLSFDSYSTPSLSLRFEVLSELNVKLWSYSVCKRALKMEAVGYTSTISCDQSGCAMSGHVILQPVCLSVTSFSFWISSFNPRPVHMRCSGQNGTGTEFCEGKLFSCILPCCHCFIFVFFIHH
jgi:hypothetical protein